VRNRLSASPHSINAVFGAGIHGARYERAVGIIQVAITALNTRTKTERGERLMLRNPKRLSWILTIITSTLLFLGYSASAQTPLTDCDRLAANTTDARKHSSAPGVPFKQVRENVNAALSACADAVKSFPNELRFQYQYARALQIRDKKSAAQLFAKLSENGYPAAFDNVGWIQISENNDYDAAIRAFRKGYELGDADCAVSLFEMIERGKWKPENENQIRITLLEKAAAANHAGAVVALPIERAKHGTAPNDSTAAAPKPAAASTPSFDCSKATQITDKTICSDGNLALLDRRYVSLYREAHSGREGDRALQFAQELTSRKMRCGSDSSCISAVYQDGIVHFEKVVERQRGAEREAQERTKPRVTAPQDVHARDYRADFTYWSQKIENLHYQCDGGYAPGCNNLGFMYQKGEGVRLDKVKAVELYTKACDRGYARGCYNLGASYESGEGVRQDKVKAVGFYKQACMANLSLRANT